MPRRTQPPDAGDQDTRPSSEPPIMPRQSRRSDASRARPVKESGWSWRSPLARGETVPHRYSFDDHPPPPPPLILRVWLRWQPWFYAAGCLLAVAVLVPVGWLVWNVVHSSPDSPAVIPITATPAPGQAISPTPSLTPTAAVITWPADIAYAAQTVPARIRNTLETPGARHGYEFTGTAGQTWRLAVAPYQDSGVLPVMQVYAPSGADLTPNGQPVSWIEWTLPESGVYRVVVSAPADLPPGGGYYLLTLDSVP